MMCLKLGLEGREHAVATMVLEDKEGYTDAEVVVVLWSAYKVTTTVDGVSSHRRGECKCQPTTT
jgi:hypothetical protein